MRLGLLPPLVVLPVGVQLHGEPAGLLLPAAAGNAGVRHHDPAGDGGPPEEGEPGGEGGVGWVHVGLYPSNSF